MDAVITYIFQICTVVVGASFIADAIKYFKNKKYYVFGMSLMLSIWAIVQLTCLTIRAIFF